MRRASSGNYTVRSEGGESAKTAAIPFSSPIATSATGNSAPVGGGLYVEGDTTSFYAPILTNNAGYAVYVAAGSYEQCSNPTYLNNAPEDLGTSAFSGGEPGVDFELVAGGTPNAISSCP